MSSIALARPLPLWLNHAYARHIVKGDFMTLCVPPRMVEQGEWVAHQVVEQYRNLSNFVRIVHEKESDGSSICNPTTCPEMSAGPNHSYAWRDENSQQATRVPASQYIHLALRWISEKIDDNRIFPTDPAGVSYGDHAGITNINNSNSNNNHDNNEAGWLGRRSGFPETFAATTKTIYRLLFRIYAHLYWNHFVDFYHLNLEKQLNSCFALFVMVGTSFGLLQRADVEPMQYLVDLWAVDGTFPVHSKALEYADQDRGRTLMGLSTR